MRYGLLLSCSLLVGCFEEEEVDDSQFFAVCEDDGGCPAGYCCTRDSRCFRVDTVQAESCVEPICEPGLSKDCSCTDGDAGAQVCATDGRRWDACDCTGTGPSTGEGEGEGGGVGVPDCDPDIQDCPRWRSLGPAVAAGEASGERYRVEGRITWAPWTAREGETYRVHGGVYANDQ